MEVDKGGKQAVTYLMSGACVFGFSYVLWGQGRLSPESGEFCTLYQGSSSNFREGDNLTTRVEQIVSS